MPSILDFLLFPVCLGITFLIMWFRYWVSQQQTPHTNMQQVGAAYWGLYAETQAPAEPTIKLPQYGKPLCSGCHSHEDPDFHHLAR